MLQKRAGQREKSLVLGIRILGLGFRVPLQGDIAIILGAYIYIYIYIFLYTYGLRLRSRLWFLGIRI